jgi:hypothetical protein
MGLWQDLQFAIRLLVKDKWFTLVATVALALGIGVNATVFTFVNAVLIRGLPFDDPEEILALNSRDVARNRSIGASYLDFKDWKDATRTFRSLAAYTGGRMNVSDEGRAPERFSGTFVSANAFSVIGQAPVLGHDFAPEDDRPGAAAVVLLGNSVWTNRYGRDRAILGRTIRVDDVPSVVIGVMPEGFRFPQNSDLWQPLALALETQKRDARAIDVYGRLAPDVPLEQARAEILAIGQRLIKACARAARVENGCERDSERGRPSGAAGVRVRRWTGALIVGELALTVVLLAGAGFMMRNFLNLYRMDLGIDTSRLVTMALALPERKYPTFEQRLAFYQRLQERLRTNTRIEAVTVTSNLPAQGGFPRRLAIDGRPLPGGQQPPLVTMVTVDPAYFDTIGLPIAGGSRPPTARPATRAPSSTTNLPGSISRMRIRSGAASS